MVLWAVWEVELIFVVHSRCLVLLQSYQRGLEEVDILPNMTIKSTMEERTTTNGLLLRLLSILLKGGLGEMDLLLCLHLRYRKLLQYNYINLNI